MLRKGVKGIYPNFPSSAIAAFQSPHPAKWTALIIQGPFIAGRSPENRTRGHYVAESLQANGRHWELLVQITLL